MTSFTPSGRPMSAAGLEPIQRPSSWTSAPVSVRWRRTSRRKNGLPSVVSCSDRASAKACVVQVVTARVLHERHDAVEVESAQRDA